MWIVLEILGCVVGVLSGFHVNLSLLLAEKAEKAGLFLID